MIKTWDIPKYMWLAEEKGQLRGDGVAEAKEVVYFKMDKVVQNAVERSTEVDGSSLWIWQCGGG